jgi:hypothetical protein
MTHAEAAWVCAERARDNELRVWVRGTQSLIARFEGDYDDAMGYVLEGLTHETSGTGELRLLSGYAQCHANLGDSRGANDALNRALTRRERLSTPDSLGGIFEFSEAKQHYYAGSSLIWLDGGHDAQRAAREAGEAIAIWETPHQSHGRSTMRRLPTSTRPPRSFSSASSTPPPKPSGPSSTYRPNGKSPGYASASPASPASCTQIRTPTRTPPPTSTTRSGPWRRKNLQSVKPGGCRASLRMGSARVGNCASGGADLWARRAASGEGSSGVGDGARLLAGRAEVALQLLVDAGPTSNGPGSSAPRNHCSPHSFELRGDRRITAAVLPD